MIKHEKIVVSKEQLIDGYIVGTIRDIIEPELGLELAYNASEAFLPFIDAVRGAVKYGNDGLLIKSDDLSFVRNMLTTEMISMHILLINKIRETIHNPENANLFAEGSQITANRIDDRLPDQKELEFIELMKINPERYKSSIRVAKKGN